MLTNARVLAGELRKIGAQLEAAAPGPPAVALILLHSPRRGTRRGRDHRRGRRRAAPGIPEAPRSVRQRDAGRRRAPLDEFRSRGRVGRGQRGRSDATVMPGTKAGAASITVVSTEEGSGPAVTSIGTVTVVADSECVTGDVAFAPAGQPRTEGRPAEGRASRLAPSGSGELTHRAVDDHHVRCEQRRPARVPP